MSREVRNLQIDGTEHLLGGYVPRRTVRTYKYKNGARYEDDGSAAAAAALLQGQVPEPARKANKAIKKTANKKQDDVYEVECVVGDRVVDGETQYLVIWVGYTVEEATWEPEENVSEALIDVYLESKTEIIDSSDDDRQSHASAEIASQVDDLEDDYGEDSDDELEDATSERDVDGDLDDATHESDADNEPEEEEMTDNLSGDLDHEDLNDAHDDELDAPHEDNPDFAVEDHVKGVTVNGSENGDDEIAPEAEFMDMLNTALVHDAESAQEEAMQGIETGENPAAELFNDLPSPTTLLNQMRANGRLPIEGTMQGIETEVSPSAVNFPNQPIDFTQPDAPAVPETVTLLEGTTANGGLQFEVATNKNFQVGSVTYGDFNNTVGAPYGAVPAAFNNTIGASYGGTAVAAPTNDGSSGADDDFVLEDYIELDMMHDNAVTNWDYSFVRNEPRV